MTYPAGLYVCQSGNWRCGQTFGPPADGDAGLDLDWPYGQPGTYKPGSGTVGLPSSVDPDSLTVYDGATTISTSNLTFSRMRFNDFVTVAANVTGIVFDQCYFAGADSSSLSSARGLLRLIDGAVVKVKDSYFRPDFPSQWVNGILTSGNITAERVEISGCCDGIDLYADTCTVKGAWIHDMMYQSPSTSHSDNQTHNDCTQVQGCTGATIVGNHYEAYADMSISTDGLGLLGPDDQVNSCVMVSPDAGNIGDMTITDNWFEGAKICVNVANATSRTISGGTSLLRNKFNRDQILQGGGGDNTWTIVLLTGSTWTTGEGTADANTYEDNGHEVTVRRSN